MVRDYRGDPNVIRGEFAIIPHPTADQANSRRSKRDAKHAEAQRKLRIIIEARLSGCSWTECARRAGYANTGTAFRVFHKYLESLPQESVERLRRVTITRLDRAIEAIWRGVEFGHLGAIETLLKIEQQRARVLGLEQAPPAQVDELDLDVLALARRYSGLTAEEVEAEVKRLDWVVRPGGAEEAG